MASSSSDSEEEKVKRKRYDSKYNKNWENTYKWLKSSNKSENHFYCNVCNADYLGSQTEIKRHEATKKHKLLTSALIGQPTISGFVNQTTNLNHTNAEIRIGAFVAEHNLPFTIGDHLTNLIKTVCPDSEVAKQISCGRTKIAAIIKNGLGHSNEELLINHLKHNKFSLIIDESTDKYTTKHLALVVRTWYNNKVCDKFLTLIPVVSARAVDLFFAIKTTFAKNKIPYKENMVGFAADGANTMMGIKHSVSTLLQEEIPNIFIMKCICHSFALCASNACQCLPDSVELLVREIYKYFQYSPKKAGEYREFQTFCDVKPHKLLHPAQTRWLSLIVVVRRVLDQWEALKLFFTNENLVEQTEATNVITSKIQNIFIKLYLQFLDFILPYITDLNVEMQSEKPKLYILHARIEEVCKTILQMFLKKQYTEQTPLHLQEYKNPHMLLSLEEVYLGGAVSAYIIQHSEIPAAELNKFRMSCLKYYQELISQLFKRYSFNRNDLKEMQRLMPKNVIDKKYSSIIPLAINFPTVISQNEYNSIDREWRLLLNTTTLDFSISNFDEFWHEVGELKNGLGELLFPVLIKLVKTISILPHSSACVERVFSLVNHNKTKSRNRLSTAALIGILHTKSIFNKDVTCFNFKINNATVNCMKSKNLYRKKEDVSDDE